MAKQSQLGEKKIAKNVVRTFGLLCIHFHFHSFTPINVCNFQSRNCRIFLCFFFWCRMKVTHQQEKKKSLKNVVSFLDSVFFLFFCCNLCYCYTQHVYVVPLHCFKRTQWLACLCVPMIFTVYTLSTNPFYFFVCLFRIVSLSHFDVDIFTFV